MGRSVLSFSISIAMFLLAAVLPTYLDLVRLIVIIFGLLILINAIDD